MGATQKRPPAPAKKTTAKQTASKKTSATKPAAKKPSGKSLTAKRAAPKSSTRKAVTKKRSTRRGRSYVKANPVPAFKPFELAGWPAPEAVTPPLAHAFPPPPDLPKNCPLCETQLLSTAYSLIGTRYRLGGTTPKTGFDCSGFVKYVYQMNFPVQLPPSAPTQFNVGLKVHKEELLPGDLVFFRTRRGLARGDVRRRRFFHPRAQPPQDGFRQPVVLRCLLEPRLRRRAAH